MQLKTNSWYALLYKFTYNSDLPQNLCPLFWKLVWAIIVFIPNGLLQGPYLVVKRIDRPGTPYRDSWDDNPYEHRIRGFLTLIVLGLITAVITTQYQLIKWILGFNYFINWAEIGAMIDAVVLILLIIFAIIKYYESRSPVYKEKKPNILVKYIKAWYHNYCPKIDWSDSQTNPVKDGSTT